MLAWASRTSAAVENCWRTPPIAFASRRRRRGLCRRGRPRARRARPGGTRPRRRSPPRRLRRFEPCVQLALLGAESVRSGARTSSRTGTPRRPSTYLAAAWNGKRSSSFRSASESPLPSRTSATTCSGIDRRKAGDRAGRTALHPGADERLGADEDVESVEQVGLDRFERLVRDLEPGEVGGALAQPLEHRHRHRVTAARLELVDIERRRLGRAGGRGQVREQRLRRRVA